MPRKSSSRQPKNGHARRIAQRHRAKMDAMRHMKQEDRANGRA